MVVEILLNFSSMFMMQFSWWLPTCAGYCSHIFYDISYSKLIEMGIKMLKLIIKLLFKKSYNLL